MIVNFFCGGVCLVVCVAVLALLALMLGRGFMPE